MLMLGMMALFFLCMYVLWAIESFEEFFNAAGFSVYETKLVFHCYGFAHNSKEWTEKTYLQLWLKTVTKHFYFWNMCGSEYFNIYVPVLPGLYIRLYAKGGCDGKN